MIVVRTRPLRRRAPPVLSGPFPD